METLKFSNSAGQLLANQAGYVLLRYAPGWHGEAEVSELLTQAGALLLRCRYRALLSDARVLGGFHQPALRWLVENWLGRTVPQPEQIFKALVIPAAPEAQQAFSYLRQSAPQQAHYVYFNCPDAAHRYLAQLVS